MVFENDAVLSSKCFFFFQAEDGIRDATVTGVQTCALPISHLPENSAKRSSASAGLDPDAVRAGLRELAASRLEFSFFLRVVALNGGQALRQRPTSMCSRSAVCHLLGARR